jgi:TolB-like protein/Flp pilus assembly protein TadD
MDASHFLAELKRRNVYKVAAAYAVVSWFLIQAASIVLPTFAAPGWTMKALIAAVAIGFPLAVFLAWAFELTPEGVIRSEEVVRNESITRRTGRKLDFLIIGVLAAVIALLLADRLRTPSLPGIAAVKGIAVLPFDNLSRDPDNAFFADGIQDDILTSLAKIADLKVISRTSVMQYRGAGVVRDLREIAQALGVENILEGSVRRVENRVLVSAQLIDARDGHHIWAERYDRTIADSIGLQGELATEIASALRAKLLPAVKASLETKPTESPDAYVVYLRGREYQMRPEVSRENWRAAENFYKQAVALDGRFVLARARLAEIQIYLYGGSDHRPARLAEARGNAERALSIDPNCGQAHMVLAQCMQQAKENPEAIKREVATAIRLSPNDGYIALAAAILQDVMGWMAESAASFERAIVLNPREGKVFYNYGVLLHEQNDVPRARWAFDRALELAPDSVYFRLFRAKAEIEWTGDIAQGKTVLAGLPAGKDPDGRVTAAYCTIAVWERNFTEALRLLAACSIDRIPNLNMGFGPGVPKSFIQGLVQFYAGDREGAYASLDSVRGTLELEALEKVGDTEARVLVAFTYAMMGWNEAAKAEIARSDAKLDDGLLANLLIFIGEVDPALSALERAAAKPGFNRIFLRLDPDWDSVRNEPRFQKLLAANATATSPK